MRILLLVVALAAPAAAEDVLDWTPADAALVVAVRGSPAGMLQGLEKRFGDVKRIKDAIGRLRAWEIKGVRPLSGDPGGTIALSRGVGLFVRGPKQVRLVIGADDAAQAIGRVAELIKLATGETAQADGKGLRLGSVSLVCEKYGGYVVCDTTKPPDRAPGKPAWLDGKRVPLDGVVLLAVRGVLMEQAPRSVPFAEIWGAVTVADGRGEVVVDGVGKPMLMAPLAMLQAEGPATGGLATVDARSAGVFKIALDGPKLLGAVEAQVGRGMPPPLRPTWMALKAAWSGELVVSFPGGLFHPVLVLGLLDEGAGRGLLQSIAALTQHIPDVNLKLGKSETGVERLELTFLERGKPTFNIAFPFAIHQKRLVIGVHPADVKRVVGGGITPAALPAEFAKRGTHGFVAWDPLAILAMASGVETWAAGPAQLILDAQTVVGLWAVLLEELGLSASVTQTGGKVRLWWRTL